MSAKNIIYYLKFLVWVCVCGLVSVSLCDHLGK